MKSDSIYSFAKKLYPNNEEAQEAFHEGYLRAKRKWHNGPRDVSVGTEGLDPEFTKKVNNWFADECPHWGCILTNNLWQYYLAKHFYELGQKEAKERLDQAVKDMDRAITTATLNTKIETGIM